MFEFGIIGGDMRSVFLAQALEARGHRVLCALLDRERPCCPPEEALAADRLILPMPPVRGGFLNAPLGSRSLPAGELAARTAGRIVYAGGAFPGAVNYAADAWLVRQNAAVTAEAAAPHYAALARRTVRGSRIAVAGFGRVGQAVAVLFRAMGADIRVAARRQAVREQAAALGFSVCPSEANYLLFSAPVGLDAALLREGIAIRSCANYAGLGAGWYRTAVRLREENEALLDAMRRVTEE